MKKGFSLFIFIFVVAHAYLPAQNQHMRNEKKFKVGMYALQPKVGTPGHQNGSIGQIKNEILSAFKGDTSGDLEGINCIIPYRHWDRINYPNWNYFGYVFTFINEVYLLTKQPSGEAGIQVFTPPLYSSFAANAMEILPRDDSFNDRNLDYKLFVRFVEECLENEKQIVLKAVKNDSLKAVNILMDKDKRPLGGWYLDDEPIIRNHDLEMIEQMGKTIRLVESRFFLNDPLFKKIDKQKFEDFKLFRYIAFNAAGIHNFKSSPNIERASVYNYDGKMIKTKKGKVYTIFRKDTYDVIMPDYYNNDISFWDIIFKEIFAEYRSKNFDIPQIMPVVSGQVTVYDDINTFGEYFNKLIQKISEFPINGLFIYAWQGDVKETIDTKDLWKHPKVKLGDIIQNIR